MDALYVGAMIFLGVLTWMLLRLLDYLSRAA